MDRNLTEALLMAGSIILGIMLLSTFIYMMRVGGSVNKAYDQTQITHQTEAYNYQFEIYQRDDNTIMDMITLLNLAYSVNSDNNYDMNNSVSIVLDIGGKKFQIPKTLKGTSTTAEEFYNENTGVLSRNKVFNTATGSPMPIYDLLNKTFAELQILSLPDSTDFNSGDKISKTFMGSYVNYPDRPVGDPNFGKPEEGSYGTTYKYVFDCIDEKLQYNSVTGRVIYMEFKCKQNPDWELKSIIGRASYPDWD